jgi:hypothetical protein
MTDLRIGDEGYPVALASGAPFVVLSPAEVTYVQERVDKYKTEFRYENVSDLQDVDQIVVKELFIHRWSLWISKQVDYFGGEVDEQALRKSINDYSGEVRQLKKALGMDKVTRDKEHGDDSVSSYLSNLKRRAMEFGINRNNMQAKTIELGQQVVALTTLHFNCDEDERLEQKCTATDIVGWLRDVFIPEFQAVDKAFREGQQKFWIQDI